MKTWTSFTQLNENLNSTIQILHHAAQFVAMYGNSYLAKQPDDSQNNLEWNEDLKRLQGRWVENANSRLSLDVVNFELILEFQGRDIHMNLDGWTKHQVLANLLAASKETGLDTSLLKPISQFTIPSHPVNDGAMYQKPPLNILETWASWLTNGNQLLKRIKPGFESSSEIRIWPHHFDLGLYIPMTKDDTGSDIQSIGAGLAIADSYVSEPYFYINYWSKETIISRMENVIFDYGYWNTRDWKGLVLPLSLLIQQPSSQQEQFAIDFFQNGVELTSHMLGIRSRKNS